MKQACENVARNILPAFRSLIAQRLIKNHGFTQIHAAEKLGTTQAAISHYLSSKRGDKYIKQLEKNPQIQATIEEIVNGLVTSSYYREDVMKKMCEICIFLRNHDLVKNMT